MGTVADPVPTLRVRLHVDDHLGTGTSVQPAPEARHYLERVMRLGSGDRIRVFNAGDGEWVARLHGTGRRLVLNVEYRIRLPKPTLGPWLAFALVKRSALELVVQKATELGVSALLPVRAARSQAERINVDRLRRIAIEAAEQSERLNVPEIREPVGMEGLSTSWPAGRELLALDEAASTGFSSALVRPGVPWGLFVGPEGGLAPADVDALGKLPFVTSVGLGPRVLRAETAAIAGLALGQALFGDLCQAGPRASTDGWSAGGTPPAYGDPDERQDTNGSTS